MPAISSDQSVYSRLLPAGVLILLLALIALLYLPGLSGGWQFDDVASLSALAQVHDAASALSYITSELDGSLKAAVTRASFALQANQWPDHPGAFLAINLILHLANAVLVFLLASCLANLMTSDTEGARKRTLFALMVTAAWVSSPLLANTSLMVVQRATLLSATFSLSGLLLFLYGRRLINTDPGSGLIFMASGLVGGTLLSLLARENSALLPALALATELTLLRRSLPVQQDAHRRWISLILGLPILTLAGYLLLQLGQAGSFIQRDFTLLEHWLSQCRIWWDYLGSLLLPSSAAITPFADDYLPSRGLLQPITTLTGLLALVVLGIGSWFGRRRFPMLSFGLAFFFAGHLIESLTPGSELYAAHRNYVPAAGLFLALCWPMLFDPGLARVRKLAIGALGTWLLLTAGVLFSITSLWGEPELAAEMWFLKHPDSERAAYFIASTYLHENDTIAAAKVFNQALEARPDSAWMALNWLVVCSPMNDEKKRIAGWERAQRAINSSSAMSLREINTLRAAVRQNIVRPEQCGFSENHPLLNFIESIRIQRLQQMDEYVHHQLAHTSAELASALQNHQQAASLLEQAYKLHPSAENVIAIAQELEQANGRQAALQRINLGLASPPRQYSLKINYQSTLYDYLQQLQFEAELPEEKSPLESINPISELFPRSPPPPHA